MRAVSLLLLLLPLSAWADSYTCVLQYQIRVGDGLVKHVIPENGHKNVRLYSIRFCDDSGCVYKSVGSTFLGSSLGAASVRVVGERAVLILRDAEGNRMALDMNSAGLREHDGGASYFSLAAEGEYNGEPLSGIVLACSLYDSN